MTLILDNADVFENLRLELRRGCLILAVLGMLRTEQYGYTLRKELADHGLAVDEGTLYPLLRRLESQGLLVSQWREAEKRNKRFYRLSAPGEQIFEQLVAEWRAINGALNEMVASSLSGEPGPIEIEKEAQHGTTQPILAGS
jgi:PadR family transcriptional regulator, regulatory protein PadR